MSKFKVGQVWKDKYHQNVTRKITKVDDLYVFYDKYDCRTTKSKQSMRLENNSLEMFFYKLLSGPAADCKPIVTPVPQANCKPDLRNDTSLWGVMRPKPVDQNKFKTEGDK